MDSFADYEKSKKKYIRQRALDAEGLAELRARIRRHYATPAKAEPDATGRWIGFYIFAAVVILMVLLW